MAGLHNVRGVSGFFICIYFATRIVPGLTQQTSAIYLNGRSRAVPFGMYLTTDTTRRHYATVNSSGIADQMDIRTGDELLLLNTTSLVNRPHHEVVSAFSDIIVPGNMTMMYRRKLNPNANTRSSDVKGYVYIRIKAEIYAQGPPIVQKSEQPVPTSSKQDCFPIRPYCSQGQKALVSLHEDPSLYFYYPGTGFSCPPDMKLSSSIGPSNPNFFLDVELWMDFYRLIWGLPDPQLVVIKHTISGFDCVLSVTPSDPMQPYSPSMYKDYLWRMHGPFVMYYLTGGKIARALSLTANFGSMQVDVDTNTASWLSLTCETAPDIRTGGFSPVPIGMYFRSDATGRHYAFVNGSGIAKQLGIRTGFELLHLNTRSLVGLSHQDVISAFGDKITPGNMTVIYRGKSALYPNAQPSDVEGYIYVMVKAEIYRQGSMIKTKISDWHVQPVTTYSSHHYYQFGSYCPNPQNTVVSLYDNPSLYFYYPRTIWDECPTDMQLSSSLDMDNPNFFLDVELWVDLWRLILGLPDPEMAIFKHKISSFECGLSMPPDPMQSYNPVMYKEYLWTKHGTGSIYYFNHKTDSDISLNVDSFNMEVNVDTNSHSWLILKCHTAPRSSAAAGAHYTIMLVNTLVFAGILNVINLLYGR